MTSTQLIEQADGVLVLAGQLSSTEIEANAVDRRSARSDRTNQEYAKQWRLFVAWCANRQFTALPADLDTIAAYLRGLSTGTATVRGKAASASTIEVVMSAITVEHRLAGHAVNRKASVLAEFVASNKRRASRGADGNGRLVVKKRPVKVADLQGILGLMRHDDVTDVRDAAILTVGFAAALRRIELSGLDYGSRGDGTGLVVVTDNGVEITLATSKSSQDQAVTLAIPRGDMPTAVDAVERWVRMGSIQPGTPLLRAISKSGRVLPDRLGPQGMALVIKARVRDRELRKGASDEEADAVAAQFSGHSLRAGFITSAAENSLPVYKIQEQSRHKSADVVRGYIREADAWNDNPLKKFGF